MENNFNNPKSKIEEYIERYKKGESLDSFGDIPQSWKDKILNSNLESNLDIKNANSLEEIKSILDIVGQDNYLFTHVTAPDIAENIYNTQFTYNLGTALNGTMTFSSPEGAYTQIQNIQQGQSPHRGLKGMFILAIPKNLFPEHNIEYKVSSSTVEDYLIDNYPSMASGKIPKEFNFAYLKENVLYYKNLNNHD